MQLLKKIIFAVFICTYGTHYACAQTTDEMAQILLKADTKALETKLPSLNEEQFTKALNEAQNQDPNYFTQDAACETFKFLMKQHRTTFVVIMLEKGGFNFLNTLKKNYANSSKKKEDKKDDKEKEDKEIKVKEQDPFARELTNYIVIKKSTDAKNADFWYEVATWIGIKTAKNDELEKHVLQALARMDKDPAPILALIPRCYPTPEKFKQMLNENPGLLNQNGAIDTFVLLLKAQHADLAIVMLEIGGESFFKKLEDLQRNSTDPLYDEIRKYINLPDLQKNSLLTHVAINGLTDTKNAIFWDKLAKLLIFYGATLATTPELKAAILQALVKMDAPSLPIIDLLSKLFPRPEEFKNALIQATTSNQTLLTENNTLQTFILLLKKQQAELAAIMLELGGEAFLQKLEDLQKNSTDPLYDEIRKYINLPDLQKNSLLTHVAINGLTDTKNAIFWDNVLTAVIGYGATYIQTTELETAIMHALIRMDEHPVPILSRIPKAYPTPDKYSEELDKTLTKAPDFFSTNHNGVVATIKLLLQPNRPDLAAVILEKDHDNTVTPKEINEPDLFMLLKGFVYFNNETKKTTYNWKILKMITDENQPTHPSTLRLASVLAQKFNEMIQLIEKTQKEPDSEKRKNLIQALIDNQEVQAFLKTLYPTSVTNEQELALAKETITKQYQKRIDAITQQAHKIQGKEEKFMQRNLVMVMNDEAVTVDDAMMTHLITALAQKTAPIIMSGPMFLSFFNAKKDGKNLLTNSAQNKIPTMNLCAANINIQDWAIYSTKNKLFYLFIPTQIKDTVASGFNIHQLDALPAKNFKLPPTKIDLDERCVIELSSLFAQGTFGWTIYMAGHGGKGSYIAGMPIKLFQEFVYFIKETLGVNLLVYTTCFGGGENLLNAYTDDLGLQELPFMVSMTATSDSVTHATQPKYYNSPDMQPLDEQKKLPFVLDPRDNFFKNIRISENFTLFFELAQRYFSVKDKASAEALNAAITKNLSPIIPHLPEPKSKEFDALGCVLYPLLNKSSEARSQHVPLVREKNMQFFRAVQRPDYPRNLVAVVAGNEAIARKEISIQATDALLWYPTIFNGTLIINGTKMPNVVSMNPGKALHIIDKIYATKISFSELIRGFINPSLLSYRLFFIKELTCNGVGEIEAVSFMPTEPTTKLQIKNLFIQRTYGHTTNFTIIFELNNISYKITAEVQHDKALPALKAQKYAEPAPNKAKRDIKAALNKYVKKEEPNKFVTPWFGAESTVLADYVTLYLDNKIDSITELKKETAKLIDIQKSKEKQESEEAKINKLANIIDVENLKKQKTLEEKFKKETIHALAYKIIHWIQQKQEVITFLDKQIKEENDPFIKHYLEMQFKWCLNVEGTIVQVTPFSDPNFKTKITAFNNEITKALATTNQIEQEIKQTQEADIKEMQKKLGEALGNTFEQLLKNKLVPLINQMQEDAKLYISKLSEYTCDKQEYLDRIAFLKQQLEPSIQKLNEFEMKLPNQKLINMLKLECAIALQLLITKLDSLGLNPRQEYFTYYLNAFNHEVDLLANKNIATNVEIQIHLVQNNIRARLNVTPDALKEILKIDALIREGKKRIEALQEGIEETRKENIDKRVSKQSEQEINDQNKVRAYHTFIEYLAKKCDEYATGIKKFTTENPRSFDEQFRDFMQQQPSSSSQNVQNVPTPEQSNEIPE